MDFFLWGHVKQNVYSTKPATIDEFKAAIERECVQKGVNRKWYGSLEGLEIHDECTHSLHKFKQEMITNVSKTHRIRSTSVIVNNRSSTSIALGATAIAATIAAVWWHRVQRKKIPTKWRRVGEISELIFYPLKSGRGFELEEAECTELGLRTTGNAPKEIQNLRDRQWDSETSQSVRNSSILIFWIVPTSITFV
ncbi:hypothetical protein ANN_10861 [Periplaneta americana]|uniref:Uncharacterized protein n=1 Tax=Periplaneta americana TaxID=6978 RepID=A0ABQ8T3F8_PERAM|nr:hypothetical protein ANN_10861 [Periplaneta americana]